MICRYICRIITYLRPKVSHPQGNCSQNSPLLLRTDASFEFVKKQCETSNSEGQMSITQHTHPAITTPSEECTSQRTFPSSYCSWLTAPMRFCAERWDTVLVLQCIHLPGSFASSQQTPSFSIAPDKLQCSWERLIYFMLASWNFLQMENEGERSYHSPLSFIIIK